MEEPVTLSADDIAEYLETADDFAFEREVYHLANEMGFAAKHAAIYTDPVTDKPRQFDIRASYTFQGQRIDLAIECKGLKPAFPLLVSFVPRASTEAYHEVLEAGEPDRFTVLATVHTRLSPSRAVLVTPIPSEQHPCIYPAGHGFKVGKSMRQVKRETKGERRGQMVGGDDVFDKWMQALASLAEMIEVGARDLRVSTNDQQSLSRIAFLPVLVVSDDTLWVANYASNGELLERPFVTEEITYYLARKYPLEREHASLTISHLHIITRSRIRRWLKEIADAGGIWQELFPP